MDKCFHSPLVKYEHYILEGLIQRMPIPEQKWGKITMNFVVDLPQALEKIDSIWVIVHRLTKYDYFVSVNMNYNIEKLEIMYI